MKASELMIGNWVYVPHNGNATHYGRITAILPSGAVEVDLNGDTVLCSSGSVAPIPLTPEILEKNKFFRDGESWWYLDFRIVLFTSNGVSLVCGRQMRFRYVHQLQKALQLCGMKKEITI